MAQAKVKTISSGQLQLDSVVTKRHIDVDPAEIEALVNKCSAKTEERGPYNPEYGKEGELVWKLNIAPPEELSKLVRICRGIFNLKDEVESFCFTIYPPAAETKKIIHTIPVASAAVAARIILCVGSGEVFTLSVDMAGKSGSSDLLCIASDAFQISFGAVAALSINYNDLPSAPRPKRKGFRDSVMKKNPTNRYVIVLDGMVSTQALLQTIKNDALAYSKGDVELATKLETELKSKFGLSDVDLVKQEANAGVEKAAPHGKAVYTE